MKTKHKAFHLLSPPIAGMGGVLLFATVVFAGETSGGWRPVYDLVMRWINFLILAFVVVKFGKTPLLNFLRGQREKLVSEIQRLEDEKEASIHKLRETEAMLADSTERFESLSERIESQGKKKKQAIIEEAQRESRILITEAKRKIDSQLLQAKNRLRAEIVDAAIDGAAARLTDEITDQDNEKFIERYLEGIERT